MDELREHLRRSYGVYGILLVRIEDQGFSNNACTLRYGDKELHYEVDDESELAAFVTNTMPLAPEQLSCREDATLLENYWRDDGTLDIYRDPREWITANPMIAELIDIQPSIGNMIDFLCEERGLFIKPPHYRLQGTYWNATSNAGLPIVRKKDPIHEGTFMLHDLFHMVVQDPLPFSIKAGVGSPTARGDFLSHRMASEAMTMVLADMHAVHTVGLTEKGYDTEKRRIYPIYRDILAHKGSIDIYDIVSANIDFCFTGETDSFKRLGASNATITSFTEKYDTFFSADYDWNDHNFVASNQRVTDDPSFINYYEQAHAIFGLPLLEDTYPESATKDVIINSFIAQLSDAQEYTAHHDEALRMKQVARRFYGGQLALFYQDPFSSLRRTGRFSSFIDLSKQMMASESVAEIRSASDALDEICHTVIDDVEKTGAINAQQAALYRMHVPLYPAFFINYQQERERIVPLQRKIAQIGKRHA